MVPYCPHCTAMKVRRSRRRSYDALFRLFGFVPFRCRVCEYRFFRFRPGPVLESRSLSQ